MPSLGRLVGTEPGSQSEFTTVQPLLQMLEDGAEADPEELREAMMEAVKEFMEENSESLENIDGAVTFPEKDEDRQALGGNLNLTSLSAEPQDAGINFLGELPITDHFLNHLPFPPPPPPPDTVSQVSLPSPTTINLTFHFKG